MTKFYHKYFQGFGAVICRCIPVHLLILTLIADAVASDHIDGPGSIAYAEADIADVYVSKNPNNPGRLIVAMTLHPFANADSHFSPFVEYAVRFRVTELKNGMYELTDREFRFYCNFDKSTSTDPMIGHCTDPTGDTISLRFNGDAVMSESGLKGFIGLRSDPFYMNFKDAVASAATGKLQFKSPAEDGGHNKNVLAIVLEVDVDNVFADAAGSTVAVIGETTHRDARKSRIDFFGRPEITNVVLSSQQYDKVNRELEVRDIYNTDDPFHRLATYRNAFMARFDSNLSMWDMSDGVQDWPEIDGHHPLTPILMKDYLLIDLSRPFKKESYFGLENSLLTGAPYDGPGGRWFNDDTCDIQYTLMITRGREIIRDYIDEATKPAQHRFPFLQPPNL